MLYMDNTQNPETTKTDKSNDISLDKLVRAHKINIARKIQAGETGLAKELEHLQNLEARLKAEAEGGKSEIRNPKSKIKDEDEIGIPENLRIKRSYTMSDAARAARSKGGQARAKECPTPNWKHGKYAQSFITGSIRPCKTTCKDYPCELIDDGSTKPGGACLDKAAVIQTYMAILDAVKNKKYDNFNEIASLTMAQSIQTLQMLLEDVIRDGPTLKREKWDKDGNVLGHEYVPHPALLTLPKMIADLGMTPQEFLATPRSVAKVDDEDKGTESLAQFLSKLGNKMQKKAEVPIDADENE